MAETLEEIASTRGDSFYRGTLAKRIALASQSDDGAMTEDDLAAHRCDWVDPISAEYRGYELHEIPPNGQGIAALVALGILRNFELASHPVDSADSLHLQIEAMKLAFADVWANVSDPATMKVTPAQMLDPAYLAQRAKSIDMKRTQQHKAGIPRAGGTIYLTAADEKGMMLSYIQSNYMGFGSGIVVPGTGISLQNRGAGFSLESGHPNQVGPRKRPFQTIIPGFLTRNGQPVMSFGVMGGNMQPQGHMQTLLRMVDYRQNPQAACDAPRFKVHRGLDVDLESTMPPQVAQTLKEMGHNITASEDPYMDFGSGQFIWRLGDDIDDGYVAASDSRRDGHAAGY